MTCGAAIVPMTTVPTTISAAVYVSVEIHDRMSNESPCSHNLRCAVSI